MKRILSALILFCFSICCVAQSFTYLYKGTEFKGKINNGVATIKSFNNKAKEVVIPGMIEYLGVSYPVKTINVFMNGVNYAATSVIIEEGVENIEKYCFNEFRKLINLSLPSTIRHIGKNAFRDNQSMSITMLSSIDEKMLRKGSEIYSDGSGTMNTHGTNHNLYAYNNTAAPGSSSSQQNVAVPDANTYAQGSNVAVASDSHVNAQSPVTQKPENVQADVDIDIPVVTSDRNANTICIIIANEQYEDVQNVEFAERDGKTLQEYCVKTLAIPEKQVKTFINASYTDIKRALNWAETISDIFDGEARILFYYAGHGIPNEKDKSAYLIPSDGFPKDLTTCFKLSDIYSRFGKMNTKGVTIILDACFSGVKRGSGDALIAARGVAIKPKEDVLPDNMIVLSATSDDETALAYNEKRHGLFTYFLLDNLKKSQGKVSFGDLFKSLSTEVRKNSMLENEKLQSPSVNVASNIRPTWEDIQF